MFLFLSFLLARIDMFENSFVLVNKTYSNKAMTIFNSESKNLTLPLRLAEISSERLYDQLFMIRFNYKNKFWFSNIKKPNYRSIDGYPYLITKFNSPEPNLNLEFKGEIDGDRIYKIISDNKCMTVGEENTKGIVAYHPLEFKECSNSQAQDFVFIPRILVEKYLQKESVTNYGDEEVFEAYQKLNKDLLISRTYMRK